MDECYCHLLPCWEICAECYWDYVNWERDLWFWSDPDYELEACSSYGY